MKNILHVLVLAVLFTNCGVAQSSTQTAFDLYVKSVKAHRPEQRFIKGAATCGLDLTKSHATYATNNGSSFTRTNDFSKAVYSLYSDFFSTAAIWIQDGQPRLIDFWSIDDSEGSESDYIICLDSRNRATKMQVTNWFMPLEEGFPGWIYTRLLTFDSDGAVVNETSSFMDKASGRKIAKPHMDSDQETGLSWVPGQDVIRDIVNQLKDTRTK